MPERMRTRTPHYWRLLIGVGARPVWPAIEGLNLPGAFPLHTMEDSFAVHEFLKDRKPESESLEAPTVLRYRGKYYFVGSHCTGWASNPAFAAVVVPIWGRGQNSKKQTRFLGSYELLRGPSVMPSKSVGGALTAELAR